MPELAEVEFYRRQWDAGLGEKILAAHINAKKRVLRGVDASVLEKNIVGQKFLRSEAHGKRMLFRFSKDIWLGIHLGMTGKLLVESPRFLPGKHDHLVLFE